MIDTLPIESFPALVGTQDRILMWMILADASIVPCGQCDDLTYDRAEPSITMRWTRRAPKGGEYHVVGFRFATPWLGTIDHPCRPEVHAYWGEFMSGPDEIEVTYTIKGVYGHRR